MVYVKMQNFMVKTNGGESFEYGNYDPSQMRNIMYRMGNSEMVFEYPTYFEQNGSLEITEADYVAAKKAYSEEIKATQPAPTPTQDEIIETLKADNEMLKLIVADLGLQVGGGL